MKIEHVHGEEVRTILRGPYCYVEVNTSPDRHKKGKEKGFDWKTISRERITPSVSGLQVIVQKWKRLLARPPAPAREGRLRY